MDDLGAMVEKYLAEHDLDWERDGDRAWYVRWQRENPNMPGISMTLRIGERTVQVESYLIREPEPEVAAEAYRWILQRNYRQYLRYACDEDGALHLVGQVPVSAFDEEELDRLIGSVLEYQTDNFGPFMQIGLPKLVEAIKQGKPIYHD